MASTYSTSLRLELMATGDQSGTWGNTTNTNLGTLLEQAITGYLSKGMADANQTLTALNGASDESRNMVLDLTGALTAARNVIVPTAKKLYLFKNSTTGGFAVTIKTSSGTGVAIPLGQSTLVYCDGTNVVEGLTGFYKVGGTDVALADGGTGASTVINAHDALSTKGTDVATAATLILSTVTGAFIDLTGVVTVTAVTLLEGQQRLARAASAFQITVGASLIGNGGGANIAVQAGDLIFFEGYAAGVVRFWVTRASGQPLAILGGKGYLYGLTLSNNVTDATNDIDIAVGEAASDAASSTLMVLAAGLTKRLDAAWAVGTGNGGLDTGAKANSTWYYLWLIRRSDTGVVDALFSLSATAPTMPTNYDQKRRLPGAIVTDSGGVIRPFKQRGIRRFDFVTRVQDVNAAAPGSSAVLRTMTVPANTLGHFEIQLSGAEYLVLTTPDQTDVSPDSSTGFTLVTGARGGATATVAVDASRQIRSRMNSGSITLLVATVGFTDPEV